MLRTFTDPTDHINSTRTRKTTRKDDAVCPRFLHIYGYSPRRHSSFCTSMPHSIHVDNRYDAPANHVLGAHSSRNVMDGNETSMKILEEAYKTYAWLGTCPAMRWGSSFEVRHGTRTSTRLPWPLRVALHGIIRGANFANCLALVTDLLPTPQRNEGHLLLDHPPHS